MENDKFKKAGIKNRTCYYLDDIIKFQDFDFDNTLIDNKSHENILSKHLMQNFDYSQTFAY